MSSPAPTVKTKPGLRIKIPLSGACISMDRRCDQFPNCGDFSDEEIRLFQILIGSLNIVQANCQLVVKGNNYIPDYAPFAVDKQGKLIRTELQIRVCS